MTPDEIVAELRDGMTIGIGGWGSRRKPMALVRAILRSPLKDLTVVSYAGPDVGLLVASGQARRVVTGFASLDSIPLEPNFRRARQDGTVDLSTLAAEAEYPNDVLADREYPEVGGFEKVAIGGYGYRWIRLRRYP